MTVVAVVLLASMVVLAAVAGAFLLSMAYALFEAVWLWALVGALACAVIASVLVVVALVRARRSSGGARFGELREADQARQMRRLVPAVVVGAAGYALLLVALGVTMSGIG